MISYDERIGVPLLEKGKMAGKCSGVCQCCQGFNIWIFIFLIIAEEISTKLDTKNFWVKGDCHILNVLLCYMYSECLHFSDYNNISKFLNRILGMEVALQNAMFKYFSDTLTAIILDAKRSGRWDMGILGKSSFLILQFI